jgi:hypothetical protein
MKMNIKKQSAKAFQDCKMRARKKIRTCFHPNCIEKSINSHILQKNGILSLISEDRHVMQLIINQFNEPSIYIKEVGLNDAFSFNCFCNEHDTNLFQQIEKSDIDFEDYRSCLLFTLRTIYYEKFKKLVNVDMYSCLESNHSNLYDLRMLRGMSLNESIGLVDIDRTETLIWNDLTNNSESYVFRIREIATKEICLSSFYTYETSEELNFYQLMNRKPKEEVIDIFVTFFPYKDKSIFMMGFKKVDEKIVSEYVDSFFTDSEEKLESKITNLMLFQCETWAMSPSLYNKRLKGNDNIFKESAKFSNGNYNERLFFDINIFKDDFNQKFEIFKKEKRLLK